jgi:hypothetical protein
MIVNTEAKEMKKRSSKRLPAGVQCADVGDLIFDIIVDAPGRRVRDRRRVYCLDYFSAGGIERRRWRNERRTGGVYQQR